MEQLRDQDQKWGKVSEGISRTLKDIGILRQEISALLTGAVSIEQRIEELGPEVRAAIEEERKEVKRVCGGIFYLNLVVRMVLWFVLAQIEG